MPDQLSVLPQVDPDALIAEAREAHEPIASFCLFSGGNDSTVLAHRCLDQYEALVHIDTGTAVPGVREHVESVAAMLGKPLRIYESGDAFRRMVLGGYINSRGGSHTRSGSPVLRNTAAPTPA